MYDRYGYGSLEKTKEVWNRTIAAGIPFVMFFYIFINLDLIIIINK